MNKKNIKQDNFFLSKKKNIYLIGIGGSGMGGIALILLKLGYKISGSDLSKNFMTDQLIYLGVNIHFQHSEKNIHNIDIIVKSSAIASTNKEIIAAKKLRIPILLRAEMLQILMQNKFGIAIAGTHGKTTTTSMIVDIFIKSQLDPTCINGGLIKSINASAILGCSRYFIVEADESDSSFLYLNPIISIVTNIESDHMDHYNSFTKLKKTFLKFLKKIPLYGTAIVCIDNDAICEILPSITCKIITYGFNKNADIRIVSYRQHFFIGYFRLIVKNIDEFNIVLNVPGKHNALNAAAAIALAIHQGIKKCDIISSLKNFKGTSRRFEFLGYFLRKKNIVNNSINAMLIDDYGHHPTELYETIKTIRMSWPKKKLIMIFQPHRYTRTYHLYHDFVKILSKVDALLLLNVYSANEKFISGADSLSLCNDVKKLGKIYATCISDYNLILEIVIPQLNGDDIILIQGAGNVDKIVHKFLIKNNKKVIT